MELWPQQDFTQLKHAQIKPWRGQFAEFLTAFDGFVTTNAQAKGLILSHYPTLVAKPFAVIPHGRDFVAFADLAETPVEGETIRLLVPGNISGAKGGRLIESLAVLAKSMEGFALEVHILGAVSPELSFTDNVICHGTYRREEFADKVAAIRPHLGAVLSIWPETWCHTLTELWACGVPVVGSDMGAVGERITDSGAGWLVGDLIAESVGEVIRQAVALTSWRLAHQAVLDWQAHEGRHQTCANMAKGYKNLYQEIALLSVGESL